MDKVKDFFKKQGIYDEDFFEYIKTKVHYLPYDTPLEWFGCFPILEDGIVKDIGVLVPKIVTEKNLLVNLHEFYHAYELYNELGCIYVEDREKREKNAVDFEKKYTKSLKRNIKH